MNLPWWISWPLASILWWEAAYRTFSTLANLGKLLVGKPKE